MSDLDGRGVEQRVDLALTELGDAWTAIRLALREARRERDAAHDLVASLKKERDSLAIENSSLKDEAGEDSRAWSAERADLITKAHALLVEHDALLARKCATCRHWGKFAPASAEDLREEEERHADVVAAYADRPEISVKPPRGLIIARRGGMGLCARPTNRDGVVEDESTLAVAVDASDYFAGLRTAADFGCVMWEAKE